MMWRLRGPRERDERGKAKSNRSSFVFQRGERVRRTDPLPTCYFARRDTGHRGRPRGVKLPKSVALFPSDPGTFCGIYGQPLLLHLISHRIWNGRLAPDRLPKRNIGLKVPNIFVLPPCFWEFYPEGAGRTPDPAAGRRTSPAPRFWAPQAPPAGPSGASW